MKEWARPPQKAANRRWHQARRGKNKEKFREKGNVVRRKSLLGNRTDRDPGECPSGGWCSISCSVQVLRLREESSRWRIHHGRKFESGQNPGCPRKSRRHGFGQRRLGSLPGR